MLIEGIGILCGAVGFFLGIFLSYLRLEDKLWDAQFRESYAQLELQKYKRSYKRLKEKYYNLLEKQEGDTDG